MQVIEIPAVEFHQGKSLKQRMYCFAVDGKRIHEFASVSRIKRDENDYLIGYQRPEVLNHVREIRRYLDESTTPIIPNAIVISFSGPVTFRPLQDAPDSLGTGRLGHLRIKTPNDPDEDKPGWIVDGQQRTAAIRDSELKSFPVCVVAFIAANESEQREHFVRVNSSKPLPKDLIFELLPETDGVLPRQYLGKRESARLAGNLNSKKDSPFYRKIRTPTCPTGIISYRAVMKMLENSFREGALYEITALKAETADAEIFSFLCDYWGSVSEVFHDAWRLIPNKSRLTHGCGIQAMGHLMEEIGHKVGLANPDRKAEMKKQLEKIAVKCAWTAGAWTLGNGTQISWNDVQNTPTHIALITNKVLEEYRLAIREAVH